MTVSREKVQDYVLVDTIGFFVVNLRDQLVSGVYT